MLWKQRNQGSSILPRSKRRNKNIKLNIFQCYAPQMIKMKKQTRNFTINCRVQTEEEGYGNTHRILERQNRIRQQRVRRSHGQTLAWQKMNENGEILADLCAFNNTIIGGSVFMHRRIHMATRVGITGSHNRKSNRPYLHRRKVRKFNAGCESTEEGGCCLEQPAGAGQNEDEANEERYQEGRATEHCTM